jgi:hypothetical protein
MRASAPGQSALLMADVAEFLTAQGVRYAVIGAMAAAVHGVVRASLDADAVVALQVREAQTLRQSLAENGYEADLRVGDAMIRSRRCSKSGTATVTASIY